MNIRQWLLEGQSLGPSFWLTPTGQLLDCVSSGLYRHIDLVIKYPQKFGFTMEEIREIYKKHGEMIAPPRGSTTQEGSASEEIISSTLARNFIRLRKVRSNKYTFIWYIDVNEFNRRTKKILSNWAYNILSDGIEKDKNTIAYISALKGAAPKITIGDLSYITESHKSLQVITLDEMQPLVETEFQQLLDEVYKINLGSSQRRVDEAGISRIVSMLKKSNSVEFVIITAFRKTNSLKVNQSKNNQLLRDFREILGNSKGFGAYRLIGHWKECSVSIPSGKTVADCSSLGGNLVDVLEESWLILNDKNTSSEDFFNTACNLATKYEQDGFISRTFDKKFGIYGSNGEEWDTFGYISTDNLTTGFAKLVGRQGYSELKNVRNTGRIFNIIMESLKIGVNIPYYSGSEYRAFHYGNILYFIEGGDEL